MLFLLSCYNDHDSLDLPLEFLYDLEETAEIAEIDRIYSAINEIRAYNSQLADALTCLADEFEYDEIMSLIGPDHRLGT